jgi:polyisoprenoid-binding protein YceI
MALARVPVSVSAAIVLILMTSVATPVLAETAETYTLDRDASAVDFTIYASKIFKFKREGQFKEFAGQLSFDPENPLGTHVDLTVYTSSIDIHNDEHNQLLKSATFFDVERFPTMHFTSSSTDMKPDGTFAVTGDLTIRGITQRMTIPVKLKRTPTTDGPPIASFESTFAIDRTTFGLTGTAKTPGVNVSISKEVRIHIAVATLPNR